MTCSRRVCGSLRAYDVTTSATTPIGTLSQKIHSQPGPSASQPPRSGPATLDVPKTAPM